MFAPAIQAKVKASGSDYIQQRRFVLSGKELERILVVAGKYSSKTWTFGPIFSWFNPKSYLFEGLLQCFARPECLLRVTKSNASESKFQLAACLTHEELNKFALLLKRWRSKEMPVLEFAQKLMELYGHERKHLLGRKSLSANLMKTTSFMDECLDAWMHSFSSKPF